jgi:hypothetical protein
MNIIAEMRWTYIVIENDGTFFIDVVCGTSAIFTVSIELNKEEVKLSQSEPTYFEKLASAIRHNPDDFLNRRSKVAENLFLQLSKQRSP